METVDTLRPRLRGKKLEQVKATLPTNAWAMGGMIEVPS